MATGFVDRWKGKITVDASAQFIAGTPLYGPASVQNVSTLTAGSLTPNSSFVDGSTVTNYGVTIVQSSAGGVMTMQAPSYVGQFKIVLISTIGSSTLFLKMGSTATVKINGSSFWIVKSSIGNSALEFVATSSVNWALGGVQNSTVTHTLSTTT